MNERTRQEGKAASRKTNTYRVTIEELLRLTVEVEAASREEAEAEVESRWKNSEYILDADTFAGVRFRASRKTPELDWER